MTGSFQQQARIRKVTYWGLIVVLFFTTLLLRKHVVEVKADELQLREKSQGDVELTGSAIYLTMTGSRGMVVCYLWITADEKKKKHEWNELELIVSSLTKLQPHFITPWQFQGWNLAYNVSVECDRVQDKYFYVTRGLDLIARGQKRNLFNPELRHDVGFFYQNKLGMADELNTFRSLFQMSCIDPRERDPKRFRRIVAGESEINFDAFETFCKDHPFLVRRLRDKLGCDKPDKVIDFLEDNARIPSLYDDKAVVAGLAQTPLKPLEERFPVLPPPSNYDPDDLNQQNVQTFSDEVDNFDLARTWFGYAQDPIEDPVKKRKPRFLSRPIFQGTPPRAQGYHAERLEQAGWFDDDGWTIRDWFPRSDAPRQKKEVSVPPRKRPWASEAWNKTFEMYTRHGKEHGLLCTPEEYQLLTETERSDYNYGRSVSNYDHHYQKAKVERLREAVNGRRQFFLADQLRGSPREALRMYRHPAAFGEPGAWNQPTGWKKVLLDHPEFRRDLDNQIEAYEYQVKYLELERDLPGCLGDQMRGMVALQNIIGHIASGPSTVTGLQAAWLVAPGFHVPFKGPLDGNVDGAPIISADAVERVRGQLEARRPQVPPSTANAPAPGPPSKPPPPRPN